MVEVVLFVIILLFIKRVFKISVFNPLGLLIIVYVFFLFFGFILLHEDYSYYPHGILFLLCAIFSFSVGYLLMNIRFMKFYRSVLTNYQEEKIPNIAWTFMNIILLFSFANIALILIENGLKLSVFSNFDTLMSVSGSFSERRYGGGADSTSAIGLILHIFTYAHPLCGGYAWVYAKNKKEKMMCIAGVLPIIMELLLSNAKLGFMYYIIAFISAFLVSYIQFNKKLPKLTVSSSIRYFILGIVAIIIFAISFILRYGERFNMQLLKLIIMKFGEYGFGHIQAFTVWFYNRGIFDSNLSFGGWTFLSISSKLGFIEKTQGIYGFLPGSSSNIYTPFRAYILDYGIVGSICLLFAMGAMVSYFFNILITTSQKHVFLQFALIVSYFCIMYTFGSPWVYTTFLLAFMLFGGFMLISNYRVRFK